MRCELFDHKALTSPTILEAISCEEGTFFLKCLFVFHSEGGLRGAANGPFNSRTVAKKAGERMHTGRKDQEGT